MKLAACVPFVLAVLLLAPVGGDAQAGPAQGAVEPLRSLALGITEGPDPIPQVAWMPFHGVDELMADGAKVYGHAGRPDLSEATEGLVVVWSWQLGADGDIAFARYNGEIWEAESLVSVNPADELDPRAFVDSSGTIHTVWWIPETSDDPSAVVYSKGTGTDWTVDLVVAKDGRRPTVVYWKSALLMAYERDSVGFGQTVVVGVLDPSGAFKRPWSWPVDRVEPLDAVLHAEGETLWIDWKHSSDEMAYSVWDGEAWSEHATVPWTDPSWTGEQAARSLVRQEVLGGP